MWPKILLIRLTTNLMSLSKEAWQCQSAKSDLLNKNKRNMASMLAAATCSDTKDVVKLSIDIIIHVVGMCCVVW
jgi:hypothetical protein